MNICSLGARYCPITFTLNMLRITRQTDRLSDAPCVRQEREICSRTANPVQTWMVVSSCMTHSVIYAIIIIVVVRRRIKLDPISRAGALARRRRQIVYRMKWMTSNSFSVFACRVPPRSNQSNNQRACSLVAASLHSDVFYCCWISAPARLGPPVRLMCFEPERQGNTRKLRGSRGHMHTKNVIDYSLCWMLEMLNLILL